VDGAIPAAGKESVATGVDGAARFVLGVIGGLGGNEIGFHASSSKNGEGRVEFPLASFATAGTRVVEQRGLAHSLVEAGLYLRPRRIEAG
jgi:hypothetical protein